MRTKRGQPQKISGLVVAALRNLRDAHGSSPKEIMKYIMAEYNASEATVQRQLKMALKRGVEYGILKKTNTGYSLNTEAEVIGPIDLAQMDACKKKRASCKPKRKSCKPKRKSCKPKRKACPRKKRKRNPCNVCASRGHKGNCNEPVTLVRDKSPSNVDEENESGADNESKRANPNENNGRETRSRSASRRPPSRRQRSRSQSEHHFSATDDDDEI